jgi:cysteine dioxygenase
MPKNISQLIGYLEGLRKRAPLPELMTELSSLDISLADVASFVRFAETTYRRNLVHAGPWHNLWVLCWKNGQRSPIHDHRGSSCAVRVLAGTMTESLFDRAANGHIKPTCSRDLAPGSVLGSADTDMHQVSNLQADNKDLITMHIYSPPLTVMGTYSLSDNLRGEEPMFLEFNDAAGI